MTTNEFFRDVSLYGALIKAWHQAGTDLVAHVELAGYNQPAYDAASDAQIRPVVLIFKSALPLDDETRSFTIAANGDARVIAQEAMRDVQKNIGTLELSCEVDRYPTNDNPGATDYVTLRLRFAEVEIIPRA